MAEDTGASSGGSSGTSSLAKSLGGKVGGIPVWGIGVFFAALLIGVLWYRNKNKAATATSATSDPNASNVTTDPNAGTQVMDPIQQWLADNPTSAAYPVVNSGGLQAATPITNEQWSRLAFDELAAKGNDPTLLSNALTKYLGGQALSAAEQAVVNLALQLVGPPPEGVLPITTTPNPNPSPSPSPASGAFATRKDSPSNHLPISVKATQSNWNDVASEHYTFDSTQYSTGFVGSTLAHYNGVSGLSNPKNKSVILPYQLEPIG